MIGSPAHFNADISWAAVNLFGAADADDVERVVIDPELVEVGEPPEVTVTVTVLVEDDPPHPLAVKTTARPIPSTPRTA